MGYSQAVHRRIGLSAAIGIKTWGINDVLKTRGRYTAVTTNSSPNSKTNPTNPKLYFLRKRKLIYGK